MNNSSRRRFIRTVALAPVSWGMGSTAHAIRSDSGGGAAAGSTTTISSGTKRSAWISATGQMASVAAGMEGSVFGLGTDASNPAGRPIFKRSSDGGTWSSIPGLAQRMAVANNGDFWAVNGQQQIFRMAGLGAPWLQQFGAAVEISARGEVWVVGTNQQVFRFNGTTWDPTPMKALKVVAGFAPGEAYALAPNGQVFRRTGTDLNSPWTQVVIARSVIDFTVDSKGTLWFIDSQNALGMVIQGTLIGLDGAGVSLSAGNTYVWLTNSAGNIFKTSV